MKEFKVSREADKKSQKGFFSGKGFYIALSLSIVAVGAAAWIGVSSTMSKLKRDNENVTPAPSAVTDHDTEWSIPQDHQANTPASDVDKSPESSSPSTSSDSAPAAQGFIMPLKGEIINQYSGDKVVKSKTLNEWVMHTGIDIKADASTPVKAVSGGTVIEVKNDSMWGACVVIEHSNGVESHYYNLKSAVNVKKNQAVKLGDVIGSVGDTAEIERAEGSHLHFAMKQNGNWIDPKSLCK